MLVSAPRLGQSSSVLNGYLRSSEQVQDHLTVTTASDLTNWQRTRDHSEKHGARVESFNEYCDSREYILFLYQAFVYLSPLQSGLHSQESPGEVVESGNSLFHTWRSFASQIPVSRSVKIYSEKSILVKIDLIK